MEDLRILLPHNKKDNKLDGKDQLPIVNEIAELKSCNWSLLFECRKLTDLYLWFSRTPVGPSVKFLTTSITTMGELKMTGNCLRGSRPLLQFSPNFEDRSQLKLYKEMLIQMFSTPNRHPNSKPFFDHIFLFTFMDERIWFRNYQILWPPEKKVKIELPTLAEIGPRFVLEPIRIFSSSFFGETLYENPSYVSPNQIRALQKKKASMKFAARKTAKKGTEERRKVNVIPKDEIIELFRK